VTTTATAGTRRRRYLGADFDALATFARSSVGPARPDTITVGTQRVAVDPWEWDALSEWARSRREESWQFLLVEGLALEARCACDLERAAGPEAATTQGWEAVCSDLHFDAILGYKLIAEVQKAVERMVVQGRIDQAKRLTQFRHRIAASVGATAGILGEDKLREAEALASIPSEAPEAAETESQEEAAPTGAELEALLKLEEKLQKKSELEEARMAIPAFPRVIVAEAPAPVRQSLRTAFASVLAALVLVWAALVAWPAMSRKPLREVTTADFQGAPAIQSVSARPPSLFVLIDDEKWQQLSDEERRTVIEHVARVVEPLGYTGAHFTGAGGAVRARWLRIGGARLVDPASPQL